MTKTYNLFEYANLDHPGSIEATKEDGSSYAERMNRVGELTLDARILKLSSNGLLLLPLTVIGPLKIRCVEEERLVPAYIHLVDINGFPFGYVVDQHDTFALDGGGIRLGAGGIRQEGVKFEPFQREERACLEGLGLFKPEDELMLEYLGKRGEITAHSSTILPKEGNYRFSNVAMRDYFAC